MRILSVVGARPQFIKLAPIAEAFTDAQVEHVILHTGQHYDAGMSEVFFEDLHIPAPDVSLGVGSGSHGAQTAAMLAAIEPVMVSYSPDWVLVYGDTNSTIAGALAAVKLHLPVAHLEAGLRSFNRRMPEEHNRVLSDHAADLLLAPTALAVENLRDEGLSVRTTLVGDVMIDVCLRVAAAVGDGDVSRLAAGIRPGEYVVATLHRAENTDDPKRLGALVHALKALQVPVVLPVHPRLRDRAASAGISLDGGLLVPIHPLSYPEMILLLARATAVATDSGGLQKEAFTLGVPCTTLRTETEWVETLTDGWNVLAPECDLIDSAVRRPRPSAERPAYFGDGRAAAKVLDSLRTYQETGATATGRSHQSRTHLVRSH